MDAIQALQRFTNMAQDIRAYEASLGDSPTEDQRLWLSSLYCLLREAWDDVTIDSPMPAAFWDLRA